MKQVSNNSVIFAAEANSLTYEREKNWPAYRSCWEPKREGITGKTWTVQRTDLNNCCHADNHELGRWYPCLGNMVFSRSSFRLWRIPFFLCYYWTPFRTMYLGSRELCSKWQNGVLEMVVLKYLIQKLFIFIQLSNLTLSRSPYFPSSSSAVPIVLPIHRSWSSYLLLFLLNYLFCLWRSS